MSQKPSIPKGTRDFSPVEMVRRNYIFSLIQNVFERYGFMPIETPAMENLSTLLGKYGEEGDRLLFKILNSGDYLSKVQNDDWNEKKSIKVTPQIAEKGLRYDLTVPFARYVVQHRNDISFPFKRYQIQPVWRADKPQRGRYREFYQCDVDVIGSNSLMNELELILIINDVFSKLDVDVKININNRKILSGISEYLGVQDKFMDFTVALDKLDKLGAIKVKEELSAKGINEHAINKLDPILKFEGDNNDKIKFLESLLVDSKTGIEGLNEISEIFTYLADTGVKAEVVLDLTLARGLNYYTGAIFEVSAKDVEIGSICGGGRYDDLTGIFGMKDVSGVGISFGADRIYDVLNQLEKFPENSICKSKVMFVNFGEKEVAFCLPLLKKIRDAGINAEIYPDNAKMKKQMTYANNKSIEFVAIVGEEELSQKNVTLKNMYTGEQKKLNAEELVIALKWDT